MKEPMMSVQLKAAAKNAAIRIPLGVHKWDFVYNVFTNSVPRYQVVTSMYEKRSNLGQE